MAQNKDAHSVAAVGSSKCSSSSPGMIPGPTGYCEHAADLFMARFSDASTRAAAAYLLRASGYLSGRVSPEKLLEFARGGKLERVLTTLCSAIDADLEGALAKAREVLDELANPAHRQERQDGYAKAGMAARPPSEKQLAFLKDLGHPNPRVFKTSAEAHAEIQRRLSQKGGGR